MAWAIKAKGFSYRQPGCICRPMVLVAPLGSEGSKKEKANAD
jgi:hypothetical protein